MVLDHSERIMPSWRCFKSLPDDTRDDRSKEGFSSFSATTTTNEEKKLGRK